MDLKFDQALALQYSSANQRARVMTEAWMQAHGFCPACGGAMERFGNNRPVADFHCLECGEEFELKSQARRTGRKVADGAYRTMIQRITSNQNPNFFLLAYDPSLLSVIDLIVIPKHFFSTDVIEERPPLSATARRKGWIGCNINMSGIPLTGRISIVRSGSACPKSAIRSAWEHTLFLREQGDLSARGWLLAVMRVIEGLCSQNFTLADIYASAELLKSMHPSNHNVEAKIRQQLQVLRNRGYLEFLGGGKYSLVSSLEGASSR